MRSFEWGFEAGSNEIFLFGPWKYRLIKVKRSTKREDLRNCYYEEQEKIVGLETGKGLQSCSQGPRLRWEPEERTNNRFSRPCHSPSLWAPPAAIAFPRVCLGPKCALARCALQFVAELHV